MQFPPLNLPPRVAWTLALEFLARSLEILVDLGEPLSALDFYHDHLIARGNCQERVIYVSALCEGGKTEAALACFKNVASAGCIPLLFTFNSLIKRLFQDGHFEDVKSLFEIMQNEGIVPNLETYLIMVNEYCKQEDLASAFGILDQMKEMGPKPNVMMHRDGLDHDEVAYMTMINAYTRNGRGDKALNLFEKMIENAIQPCSYSYTALLSGSKIKADLFLRIAWISGVCGNITVTKKRWHMTNRISKRARDLLFNLLHQKASLPGEDVFTDPAHSP
ncbi:hypothetical protein OIU76_015756 [Salix suchowensis]|nr:hypothetical protein OIU76_015756 [Salix suchowensis]